MKAPVKHISPNFTEGWNGKADPTELPANAFSGKNWIPSWKYGGALEKVRVRRQDLLSLGTGSQDDRIYSVGAGFTYSRYIYPDLHPYDDVFFAYTNSYSLTSATTAQTPASFAMWHATPANVKCKFGIKLEKEVKITTVKALIVAIRLQRIAGAFDSTRHKLTATLYPAQTTSSKPTAVTNVTTPTYTAECSTAEWQWAEFHFLSSSGDIYLSAGEWFVELTDTSTSGASVTAHYEIALSDTNTDPNGWAVSVNNAGTTAQALADCIVFQRKGTNSSSTAQDSVTASVELGLRALRDENTSNILGSGANDSESFERAIDAYYFTDRFGIYMLSDLYGPLVDRLSVSSVRTWDGHLYNDTSDNAMIASAPSALPRFMGRIESWCTYQRKLILGGIGGLAIVDPTDVSFNSGGGANVAVPDIGNRQDTVDYEWVTTHSKDADVYPPVVRNVFKAGINPGRIFATVDDTIIWSGGTTAATVGTATTWSVFATVQFGDTRDTILKACWFKGYILLFTQNGDLYFFTGEPPIDPTNGYGTMRADYLCRVGQVSTLEVSRDGVWFATDDGRQLWFMDHAFVPRRVDDSMTDSIKVNNIFWDELTDRVWVASERHAKRSYLTAVTTDNTLTSEYQEACSYMLDSGKWYKVQRALDTDTTANQPDTFIFGPLAVKIGAYWEWRKTAGTYTYSSGTITPTFTTGAIANVGVGDLFYETDNQMWAVVSSVGGSTFVAVNGNRSGNDFYTIKSTPYALLDYADGFIDVYNTSANSADPENSDNRASSVTADLYTKELDFTEASGLLGAEGAIKEVFFSGYLVTGSTCTVYAVEQDGTETTIATITADASVSSPVSTVYRAIAGAMNRTGSARIKISVAGKYKDVIRNVGFSGFAYGQKGASA